MRQTIATRLEYALPAGTAVLLQIEPAALPDQTVSDARTEVPGAQHFARIPAEAGIGQRLWLRTGETFVCTHASTVETDRPAPDLAALAAVDPHLLGPEPTRYLMPSRYCDPQAFQAMVGSDFGGLTGGALVAALNGWIGQNLSYVPGVSDAATTATDTYLSRQGVCRDYAHVLIAMARAAGIPARIASAYAPDVTPQDFHAVADVFLAGGWHLVDPTNMARSDEMARIGVGLDAAEVSFMTAYAPAQLISQEVTVTRA